MNKSTVVYDKLFKIALATTIATSALTVVAPDYTKASENGETFTDIKVASDYYEYVNELFERGFVSGYKDGSFKPGGLLTRAEASKILALNLGLNVTKSFNPTFKDVPTSDWAYPYIEALKEAGIIDGFQDGTFKPNTPITRNQMAKIIVNGYGLEPAKEINLPFTDTQLKNNWAAPYIQTLYDLGITTGQSALKYGGISTVTRGEMAAFTIRSEKTTDYRDNRQPDEKIISDISGNKMTMGGQVYYIKKELQPLLHSKNLAALNEANLDFIKIGTKIIGIRNLELIHGGTADNPLTLDLAGGTVEANITIAGDYIKLANANITGDITIKKGDQKQIELNGLALNGNLIIEGDTKREQKSVIKLTNTTVDEIVVNRDNTEIVTNNATPSIKVGNNVSSIEVAGKMNSIHFNGNQNVVVKGQLETNHLTIDTPIKVTLENKAQLSTVETKQYGSQLIVPKDTTIDTLIKPVNINPEEAVKYPGGISSAIKNVTNIAQVERSTPPIIPTTPTAPSSGGGFTGGGSNGGGSTDGGNNGGIPNPFVSQTLKANNIEDTDNEDPLAVGMIGTTVTSNNETVATATLKDGEIIITSKGPGTATISIKEDAPSLKESQIIVTVDANGKMTHTIKRPIEVMQDKINATPAPAAEVLIKLFEGMGVTGVTPENITDVTTAVKKAIAEKGKPLTENELKLVVDTALLPSLIKKGNPSLEQVSTPLDLVTMGPNGTSFKWDSATKVGDHNASIDLSTGNVTQDDADNENDQVTLKVTATNGNATKEASIGTTVLESKKPYLVSAILNDIDKDGNTSAGDTITFKFSEPVRYSGNTEDHNIDEHLFGKDFVFGMGDDIKAVWSEDGTSLTMTIGGDTTSPNVFKVGSEISLVAGSVKDANGGQSITNSVKLQHVPFAYEIAQNDLTGDFIWENNVVVSEAAGKIQDSITFSQNGEPVEGLEISYTDEDLAQGSIASGSFSLKSVNVTKNGNLQKITFADGETLKVTTSTVLRVKDSTEVVNSVNHNYVKNGLVKIIRVDDSVTDSISVPKVDLANPIIIEGQNKLVFMAGVGFKANQNEVLLKSLKVTGGYSTAQNGDRGPVYISGSAKVTFDDVTVDAQAGTGGYGYSAILLKNTNAKLVIKDSKIQIKFDNNQNPTYYAYGIRADAEGASIDIINSTISSNGANGGSRVIQTARGANVNITDSKINAEADSSYTGTVYGINLGDGSSLKTSGASEIVVKAPAADGFGIGNNVNYTNLNVSDTTVFDIDDAASGKRKAPYEYDLEALAALNNAWAKMDESLVKANNPTLQEVTEALNLPTDVDGVSVSWAADTVDGATVNADGTVTRSSNDDADDVVTLTATLTHNGMTKTKDFQVTIKENRVPTINLAALVDGNTDGKANMGERVELTFSEPVTFSQLSIGDQEIDPESGVWSEDKKTLTVTLAADITVAGTVTVKVTNLEDAVHNTKDESVVELTVPSAIEAFKMSYVSNSQNGAEPITETKQGIYKFSVDINLSTDGEGFAVGGVYVAQVSGTVLQEIETPAVTDKYDVDVSVDDGRNPKTIVTVTEKVANGTDQALTKNIRYPGITYKAEIIQPSLVPSPGSQQIASFTISDVIALEGTTTRNQTIAITIDGTPVKKVITLSSEATDSTLAAAIAEAFTNAFPNYAITAENNNVIITANAEAQNVLISAELK
ncbi:S-layer homology domain-containing protein [Paenibacillus pabuli]|uniref:S-layer homology domain-containing protein n=1 Tax=Paenibacillus pabuli TaxID=1472 RepID=UPI000782DE68|nr:S-layer homology domain-containing protein [Paenibacillus pabuli]MEC0123196.1 S-layer homology domain-containing protein [Paenibacillus pabuli]